jgi:cytochrome c553
MAGSRTYACGFAICRTAWVVPKLSLAGLPAAYIAQQLTDFKSGARRSAERRRYR